MKINLFNAGHLLSDINLKKIIKAIEKAFNKTFDVKEMVGLILIKSDAMAKLNKKYRNFESPTDVLSFSEDEKGYLGEVFICDAKVYEQAGLYEHAPEREFAFLLTHGLLHLLGYDHHDPEKEKAMLKMQDTILNQTNYRKV